MSKKLIYFGDAYFRYEKIMGFGHEDTKAIILYLDGGQKCRHNYDTTRERDEDFQRLYRELYNVCD